MKIIVLGAGIVGVTTAYFLSRSGHNVYLNTGHGMLGSALAFGSAAKFVDMVHGC